MIFSNTCNVSSLHLTVDGIPLIKSLSHSIAYSIAPFLVLNYIAVLKYWKMHNIYDCWCHCLFFFVVENNCNALNPLYLNEVSALLFMFWEKKRQHRHIYSENPPRRCEVIMCCIWFHSKNRFDKENQVKRLPFSMLHLPQATKKDATFQWTQILR